MGQKDRNFGNGEGGGNVACTTDTLHTMQKIIEPPIVDRRTRINMLPSLSNTS